MASQSSTERYTARKKEADRSIKKYPEIIPVIREKVAQNKFPTDNIQQWLYVSKKMTQSMFPNKIRGFENWDFKDVYLYFMNAALLQEYHCVSNNNILSLDLNIFCKFTSPKLKLYVVADPGKVNQKYEWILRDEFFDRDQIGRLTKSNILPTNKINTQHFWTQINNIKSMETIINQENIQNKLFNGKYPWHKAYVMKNKKEINKMNREVRILKRIWICALIDNFNAAKAGIELFPIVLFDNKDKRKYFVDGLWIIDIYYKHGMGTCTFAISFRFNSQTQDLPIIVSAIHPCVDLTKVYYRLAAPSFNNYCFNGWTSAYNNICIGSEELRDKINNEEKQDPKVKEVCNKNKNLKKQVADLKKLVKNLQNIIDNQNNLQNLDPQLISQLPQLTVAGPLPSHPPPGILSTQFIPMQQQYNLNHANTNNNSYNTTNTSYNNNNNTNNTYNKTNYNNNNYNNNRNRNTNYNTNNTNTNYKPPRPSNTNNNNYNNTNNTNYRNTNNTNNNNTGRWSNFNNRNQPRPPSPNKPHYKTPSPKRQQHNKQKQQLLDTFVAPANPTTPFENTLKNEPLPDKEKVHREIKKFNQQRKKYKLPLIDEEASKMWVYPKNLNIRKYQFEAVKQSLFTNELVCFPTGMGKTLIAAVVMYNFYRWYPNGIVAFACPTRALVEQQMNACYDFLDVPQQDYADLTGKTSPAKRVQLWKQARFYFCSPQTLKSDLQRSTVPIKKFVCVVIDEAHKAQGEHSYHTMIRDLLSQNPHVRILALTATPGSTQEAIQSLIDNLRLSKMVIKYNDDPDIKRYRFKTNTEIVDCALSDSMKQLRSKLTMWISKQLDQLFRFQAIRGFQPDNITFWNVQSESQIFAKERAKRLGIDDATKWICISRFGCLGKLVMLRERMEVYSIGVMLKKLQDIKDMVAEKPHGHRVLNKLLKENEFNEWWLLCRKEIEMQNVHPKIQQLGEILTDHFEKCQYPNSRVIIFSSLRYSVVDIVENIKQFECCKPYHFVGQSSGKTGKGLTNKEQQQVIQDFKTGKYNILVSTCVGEEGLDIGQVDIVVHYDIRPNVLRNIQRSGRTGRKREGRVIYLWSTKKEKAAYKKMQNTKNTIRKIDERRYIMFENAPRMFPIGYNPSLIRLMLEPPADFIRLSERKKMKFKNRTNSKRLYQPGYCDGLLTLTQHIAFEDKFEIKDKKLENRMNSIIEDAIENCSHIQSEFTIGGNVRPSVSTKFMVRVLRCMEDEDEFEAQYQQLFPNRRKQSEDIRGYLPDINDSDEFESESNLYPNSARKRKRKIRDAKPLFSEDEEDDESVEEKKDIRRRGGLGKIKHRIQIVQDDDELDSEYDSLMNTDSDDCKILGSVKRERKKKRDKKKKKKRKKKKRRKKTLEDIDMDSSSRDSDIEMD
eukprot:205433_1